MFEAQFFLQPQLVSHNENCLTCEAQPLQQLMNILKSSLKCLFFFYDFNQNRIISTNISKNPKYEILWISVWWASLCFMRTDRHV
jgi:hypothetical protein